MPFENGVYWKPLAPQERGRHSTFAAAVSAAFSALSVERNSFFDAVANDWAKLFPSIAARPGRYEDGKFFIGEDPEKLYAKANEIADRLRQE